MITGAHVILFVPDADATRTFLATCSACRRSTPVAAGPIFARCRPSRGYPTTGDVRHELYLMCDDLQSTIVDLGSKGVEFVDEPSEH